MRFHSWRRTIWMLLIGAVVGTTGRGRTAEALSEAALLEAARVAYRRGKPAEALKLADQAVTANPASGQALYVRGWLHGTLRDHEKAFKDYDRVIELSPNEPQMYQTRGVEHFRAGHFTEAIADFDKFLSYDRRREAHHWQRGIAYYLAGRYEEGRKQFEQHQTVNPEDVENSVWHFACVARSHGIDRARSAWLPVKEDSRAPMLQVQEFYLGKMTEADLIKAAESVSGGTQKEALFYARLYLGLYHDAAQDTRRAQGHLEQAVELAGDHFMGDVARVYAKTLRERPVPAALPPKR